jgi:hypothetical protein
MTIALARTVAGAARLDYEEACHASEAPPNRDTFADDRLLAIAADRDCWESRLLEGAGSPCIAPMLNSYNRRYRMRS